MTVEIEVNVTKVTVEVGPLPLLDDVSQGLSGEIAARTAGDTGLQNNINDEIAARQAAIEGVQEDLNAEALARTAADNGLQNNINAEATARANADALKADKATVLTAGGLATGGGDLSTGRTITVPKASGAEAVTGTDDTKALTPLALKSARDADAALKADKSLVITAAGLATGGGDLSTGRTITVPKASGAEALAGMDDTKALTPLAAAAALQPKLNRSELTEVGANSGGTVSVDVASGADFPILFDSDGRLLDKVRRDGARQFETLLTGLGFTRGLQSASAVLGQIIAAAMSPLTGSALVYTGTGPRWPILLSSDFKGIIEYDETDGLIFLGETVSGSSEAASVDYTPVPLAGGSPFATVDRNGFIANGQSLSLGRNGTPIVSTTQPFSNLTFGAGPKATKAGSTASGTNNGTGTEKPLVEDVCSESAVTGGGETICSGAVNGACTLYTSRTGSDPNAYRWFASACGHGGYSIVQLNKGSTWYQKFIDHVTDAKALADAATDTYALQAVPWIQGEDDNGIPGSGGMTETAYYDDLTELFTDMDADAKAITGQTNDVQFLLYQTVYRIAIGPGASLAQLRAAQTVANAHFVTPIYFLPHDADETHLDDGAAYKWLAGYFARAMDELAQGVEPSYLKPRSATYSLSTGRLSLRYFAPTPLVLDVIDGEQTPNRGLRVVDDEGTTITLSAITARGDTVGATLSTPPLTNPKVRVALDYCASDVGIVDGATCDIRDSSTDTTPVGGGATRPLYRWSPAFELDIIIVE